MQTSAAGQTFPHPPQLLGSLVVFTLQPSAGLPSQFAVPAEQVRRQAPVEQACRTGQTVPQLPQLFESVDRVRQAACEGQ